ncbi:MAG: tRNA lysidine(34) synthetase TilS [Oscillospiraceae bacterium]|nr:tRNA lysidine(34) synthetase TilS [Oscillospiraceae bacterium]
MLLDKTLFTNVRNVLVGFSGGSDSTSLLHYLKYNCGFELYAVHVNHNLRGEEALRDQHFCEDFCKTHDIKLFVESIKLPNFTEEAARNARYQIFDRLLAEHKIDRVATAHNLNDNAETVMFNIIRGTALNGLCGIPPTRGNIIRPLLNCSKQEILDYCAENNLEFVTDSTNADLNYTRNYIRHEIMPRLRTVNPAADEAIMRMCVSLRRDNEFINSVGANLVFAREKCDYDNGVVNTDNDRQIMRANTRFAPTNTPDAILSRHLIARYHQLNPDGYLSGDRINELIQCVRNGYPARISLPGRITFETSDCEFVKDSDPVKLENLTLNYGENPIPFTNCMIFLTESEKDIKPSINIYKLFIHKKLNFDKMIGYIYIRSRLPGDKYRFGGMTRSVKKLINASRVPIKERDSVPFVCDDSGIIWVPPFEVRDGIRWIEGAKPIYVALYKRS